MFFILLFSFQTYKIDFSTSNITYLRKKSELNILAKDVKKYVGNNENFFFVDYFGYFIKLYYDIPISQYDLLLSGNVGYKGMPKKLKELDNKCKKEKCYFFVSKELVETDIIGIQTKNFYSYIKENYKKEDELYEFEIYTNEKNRIVQNEY